MTVTGARGNLALHVETRERRFHQCSLAVEHSDVHARSLRVLGAFVERRDDSNGCEKRGTQVAKARAHASRRRVGPSGQAHDAAHRLHHHVVTRQVAVGAAVTEAGDRRIDDVRMRSRQALCTIAEPVHHAGSEVFDQDVRFVEHALEECTVSRTLDVEHDALFAAVEAHEVCRLLVHEWTECSGVVTCANLFDLDDSHAQIAQDHRAVGPRKHTGEVQYRDPVQRALLGAGDRGGVHALTPSVVCDDPARRLLGDHQSRAVRVPAGNRRHHARIDDTQAAHAPDTQVAVHDGAGVRCASHLCSANRVEDRRADVSRQLRELLVRPVLLAGFPFHRLKSGHRWL